ncbi:helix-turn-helix domain-containing protein [Roseibium sp.]|uniref:helix-turn-helix domain-containing protein n=1 Tax=Roseibium sp. TaxID=1936156 RepID=UPI003BB1599F
MEPKTELNDDEFIGFWVRCCRDTLKWSQEALAETSSIDVRTIQRIEAGKRASVTTKAALAKALGYEENVFDNPMWLVNSRKLINELQKEIVSQNEEEFRQKFPNHVLVKVEKVTLGIQIGNLCECEAYFNEPDADLSKEAIRKAAELFDCLRDYGDCIDVMSFSDKTEMYELFDEKIAELHDLGAALYVGQRETRVVGELWKDKTPISLNIGYLFVMDADKEILSEVLVPRRLS